MHLKLSSAKGRPFCPGEDELTPINKESPDVNANIVSW